LPFEDLEAITTSLAITGASTYAVALSSLQTIASIRESRAAFTLELDVELEVSLERF